MNGRLDSRALRLFVAVAQALSFRQAAQSLHMSQPPLSRAIAALEARLGTRLFERDTRAVALTPAGARLLPRAQHILQLLDDAEADAADHDGPAVLRLGLSNAVEPPWFQHLAERLARARPPLTVQAVFAPSPRLVRQLRAGRLDAAFIAWPTEAAGLEVVEIERHPMCAALASGHRLARRRIVSLADLAREPVFWFERARQPAFFERCEAVFRQHGFAPPMRLEPLDPHVLLTEVAAGRGTALMAATFRALRRRGVVYRTLREGDALSIGVALALPDGRRGLREQLLEAAREPGAPRTVAGAG